MSNEVESASPAAATKIQAVSAPDHPSPRELYSVPVPDATEKPGEGIPRRHPIAVEKGLVTTFDPEITTLHECFLRSRRLFGDRPFMGSRHKENGKVGPYVWKTYEEIAVIVDNIASALINRGLPVASNIGLFSVNREEWVIGGQSCYQSGLVTVPLYDTLGHEAIVHICNQTELSLIFCTHDKAEILLQIKDELSYLKTIVVMDVLNDSLKESAKAKNTEVILFTDLEKEGQNNVVPPRPPKADDLCTICYTSGTTGLPKGVMLSHRALVAEISAIMILGDRNYIIDLNENDVHLSYLPLAHVLERAVVVVLSTLGAKIGFYQGETLKIMDDAIELKPTLFVSVPRLYNRIYDKVFSGLKSKGSLSQYLFKTAYAAKEKSLKHGSLTHWLWDSLVFSNIRNRLGGNVRAMITGSAPISGDVMTFLRICFSCEVYEGYGQTETAAGSCLTQRGDWSCGHVGGPMPVNDIKLVDVPDMGYTSADKNCPKGEICFRGPNCFTGYYKDEEKTKESLDEDNWVHSGDIGTWDELGRLKIIDRKKNMFKLAQGEYIAPEKIENYLSNCSLIEQIFVHGNSLKSSLVAIVVPDKDALKNLAAKKSISGDSMDELCASAEMKKSVTEEIVAFARNGKTLKGFEIPRAFYLESKPFTVENDFVTSTFKLKRHTAAKHYSDRLDDLYKELKE